MSDDVAKLTLAGAVVSSCLHSAGLYLLYRARKTRMDPTQRVIITNLSFTELVYNLYTFTTSLLVIFNAANVIPGRVNIFVLLSFNISFYMSTLLITANRFARVYLNANYVVYWSDNLVYYCVAAVYGVSVVTGTFIAVYGSFAISTYCVLTLDVVTVVAALLTYGYALWKMAQQKRLTRADTFHRRRMFKGFMMSGMIVLTFVIFMVVPQAVRAYFGLTGRASSLMDLITEILLNMAFWSDALIYTFMCPHVRAELKTILFTRKCERNASKHRQSSRKTVISYDI